MKYNMPVPEGFVKRNDGAAAEKTADAGGGRIRRADMELKNLEESSIKARDSYNKARSACVRLTGDAAIARFKEVVQDFPDLAPAREKLRELELAKLKTLNGWGRFMARSVFQSLWRTFQTLPMPPLTASETTS